MSENRVLLLDDPTRLALWEFGQIDEPGPTIEEVQELLPEGLSRREMGSLGLQISCFVERINPSRNALSHGRKAEDSTVFNIGSAAILTGDYKTAESAIAHMKRDKLSPMRFLGGMMLSRELKKRRPQPVSA